ncbi:alpha/beta hydrolase [Myceligenerans pegani]|uniref:Alpha/beta hydrolase n=1 Tax=Myceligenerans pegani TaxID=2776917 RepID=A0ABR9MST0_9MICO|nr:alpha/beta hydrolase [Myceligenerans sp. TRM 65318]MBE1874445.1 alpha/beta hydrolase [Myceligenerans sp. TRM 65318]MBE3016716.1 alpha/beta hydrolase [Myceligenerans sp. TRM 65318]
MSSWSPDVLGDGFEARSLSVPAPRRSRGVRRGSGASSPDDRAATLVRHVASTGTDTARPAVLYVHGFVDYFFQTHVAEHLAAAGYPFYAVDLRGYGRSVREHDDRTIVPFVHEHAADLDAATDAVRAEGHERIVILGHSTGGLIASLWAAARPGVVVGLVLNSPWVDLNRGWFDRVVTTQLMRGIGAAAPRARVSALGGDYANAMHRDHGGEWDFDLRWKPDAAFPVRAGWLNSVRRAHARLARGLSLDIPVLVTTSDRTTPGRTREENTGTDAVLDVRHMWKRAPKLGSDVQVEIIPGGSHDLALSPAPARDLYLKTITDWLDTRF